MAHDSPAVLGGLIADVTVSGAGVVGGVVSMPLSSIIFSAVDPNFSPEYDCKKV